jgi:nucleotide-binding universal stress UspA family protein
VAQGGPVIIGLDGSKGSEDAIRQAGALLAGHRALVVVVWKAGIAYELLTLPSISAGIPPTSVELRAAMEAEQRLYERALKLSEQGAQIAQEAGFKEAEGLVVRDEPEIPVAETLTDVARERDAAAIVVNRHPRKGEWIIGSTTRDVIRHATCAVVVTRTGSDEQSKRH